MQQRNPSMTSREAAALILSEGRTTDVEEAEAYASGQLLDPEALERAAYRRMMGFDFEVVLEPKSHRAIVIDKETGNRTTATWIENDDDGNARRLAKACVKLKKMHEAIDV